MQATPPSSSCEWQLHEQPSSPRNEALAIIIGNATAVRDIFFLGTHNATSCVRSDRSQVDSETSYRERLSPFEKTLFK